MVHCLGLGGSASSLGARKVAALLMTLGLVLAACTGTQDGDDAAEPEDAEAGDGESEADGVDALTIILGSGAFSATYFPLYVAEEQGYFEDEGLTVEIQPGPGSANAVQQLIAGQVDVAMSTPAATLAGAAQGFELAYVMGHWYEGQFNILVPEDSGVTDFSQLEGGAIGIPELSGSEVIVTEAALLGQGWTPGIDVQLTVVGEGATMLRALEQGQVDAVASNFPNELQLEAELGGELMRITPEEVQFFGDGIVAMREALDDPAFRDAVVRLVRATIKGRLWAEEHPDDAYAIIKANWSKEQLGDPGDESYGRPYFAGLLEVTSPKGGVEYGYLEPGSLQNVADYLTELGQLEMEIDAENVMDETVTDDAWEEVDADDVRNQPANFNVP